eukprot:scaffold7845_cov90-Isochrysis_galbana.AAC.1
MCVRSLSRLHSIPSSLPLRPQGTPLRTPAGHQPMPGRAAGRSLLSTTPRTLYTRVGPVVDRACSGRRPRELAAAPDLSPGTAAARSLRAPALPTARALRHSHRPSARPSWWATPSLSPRPGEA